jgi:hypothetical protein
MPNVDSDGGEKVKSRGLLSQWQVALCFLVWRVGTTS